MAIVKAEPREVQGFAGTQSIVYSKDVAVFL